MITLLGRRRVRTGCFAFFFITISLTCVISVGHCLFPLGVIGKLRSVLVAFPERLPYYFLLAPNLALTSEAAAYIPQEDSQEHKHKS